MKTISPFLHIKLTVKGFPSAIKYHHEVIDLFRERHSIYITVLPFREKDSLDELVWYYSLIQDSEELNDILCNEIDLGVSYNNYDDYYEALNSGILEALELI